MTTAVKAHSVCVHPVGRICPFGVILNGSPNFIALYQVVAPVNFHTGEGVSIQAVVPDDTIMHDCFLAGQDEQHNPASRCIMDVVIFYQAIAAIDPNAPAVSGTVRRVGDFKSANDHVIGGDCKSLADDASLRLKCNRRTRSP